MRRFLIITALFLILPALFAIGGAEYKTLLKEIDGKGFATDKLAILGKYVSIYDFTVAEAAAVIGRFSFSTDKLKALAMFSNSLSDLSNSHKLAEGFSFTSDKEKVLTVTAQWKAAAKNSPQVPDIVKSLAKQLSAPGFSKEKMALFKKTLLSLKDPLSAHDILTVMGSFDYSADKVDALAMLGRYAAGIFCADAASILKNIPFSADRLKVLGIVKDWVFDTQYILTLIGCFDFEEDIVAAWKILKTVKPVSLLFGIVKNSPAVFVIDFSGSMTVKFDTGGGSVTRLDYVLSELENAITNLPSTVNFNIIAFHTEVYAWYPLPQPATPENIKNAVKFAKSVGTEGGTAIYDALKWAYTQKPKAIYFLTDGIPTHGEKTAVKDILDDVRLWNISNPCPIFAIAFLKGNFAGDDKAASKDFLSRLAELTGGTLKVME
ncbi:MAG: hypothetical protein A2Y33_15980 [Spirochaetes bacterium GWF1_51_8]|nr:MAG: hypothetical protein A2Y33_15980 [Spirochaetes bacterium GWF1_51_8]